MFRINELIDDTYLIIQEIGHGGTGVVFLAYHSRLEKYVVLKRIKDNFVGSVNVRAEVDILKKLHHRYLPQVYDFVQHGSEVYTVIDYIEGYDLEYYMQNGYQFTEEEIVKWLKQLCEVLDYLHSQEPKILHSDIKPGNIMINQNGDICLIDFNISFDETIDQITGLSQYYAAPEQLEKAEAFYKHLDSSYIHLDERMDIYSLAATFYYIMSGIRPTCNYQEIYPIQYMDLPYKYGLLCIVEKAMRLNREERYQSVAEMKKALDTLQRTESSYKIKQLIKYGSILLYSICLSVGVLLCIEGNKKIKVNNFNQEYAKLIEIYNAGNNELIISNGIKILNNRTYDFILEKDSSTQAKIYHAIGEGFYYSNDYRGAESYYKTAFEISEDEDKEPFFYDYAIDLLKEKNSNITVVENLIQELESSNKFTETIKLIHAQIDYHNEKYDSVKTITDEILNNSETSNKDKESAYILRSEVAVKENDFSLALDLKEKAYQINPNNKENYRNIAKICVEYAEQNKGLGYSEYYKKAQAVYEDLINSAYPTIEDQINLVILYQIDGSNTLLIKGRDILLKSEEKYSDYRIQMNLAFIYHQLGENVKSLSYCRLALQNYSEEFDSSRQNYNQLMSLKQELER